MKLHMILVIGFVLGVTACAEKEQVSSEPVAEAQSSATEDAAPWAADESWRNEDFLNHMHLHAEKLDEINFALADGKLAAAVTPASWLATHETFDGVQPEWLPYLYGMRTEAAAVEAAPDLDTARAAAERINTKCQGCHAAAGVSTTSAN